jgi:MerR family transcriptional regulator, mercuric resistance operon regulatory protein
MTRSNTNSRAESITIGALSELTGVNIETIRYYEKIGLLPPPRRSEGRHRLYDLDLTQRLQFVRRSRQLGFSIEEIKALLHLVDQGGLGCREAKGITERHLADIRGKISDLKRLERVLGKLATACEANELPQCPLLETLSKGS